MRTISNFFIPLCFGFLLLPSLTGCVAQSVPSAPEAPESSNISEETDGSRLIEKHCLSCHLVEKLHQYNKTEEQWNKTLQKMISNYGVDLTDGEKAILVDYLTGENNEK